jgi:membrane protein DedA with SNARE-associated domain
MDTLELISATERLYIQYGYLLVFISSFIEITPMGWTIPGGVILATGGYFAFSGHIHLLGIILAGWMGAWLTFLLAYLLGLKSGNWLITKLHQEKNAQKAKGLLKHYGATILTTSMLAYVAGVEKFPFRKFFFYSAASSLTWVSLMAAVGYIIGSERGNLEKGIAGLGAIAWLLLILAIGILVWSVKKEFNQFRNEKEEK